MIIKFITKAESEEGRGKAKYTDISMLHTPGHFRQRHYFSTCTARLCGGIAEWECPEYNFHFPPSSASQAASGNLLLSRCVGKSSNRRSNTLGSTSSSPSRGSIPATSSQQTWGTFCGRCYMCTNINTWFLTLFKSSLVEEARCLCKYTSLQIPKVFYGWFPRMIIPSWLC